MARSIKVNVRFSPINSLRYLTFSSICVVYGRLLPGFRSVADPRSTARLQIAFTEQRKLPTLFRKFCNNCSISKTKFLQCLVRYFTHNQSDRPNCDYDLKYWRTYYNAMLHVNVNIKIMTSRQRWYLLLSYFNNEINFLLSCEIRCWSLRFRQFEIRQVNTAQISMLVHNTVTNQWAKFGAKIFRHFWDIAIFVLGYIILPHPVYKTITQPIFF